MEDTHREAQWNAPCLIIVRQQTLTCLLYQTLLSQRHSLPHSPEQSITTVEKALEHIKVKDLLKKIIKFFTGRCECGGIYTDGGGYNHLSCNNCGEHY